MMMDFEVQPLCTESYGSRSAQHYQPLPDGSLNCVPDRPEDQAYRSLRDIFTSVFLPQGYPKSVSPDYLAYQVWDTVQAFASSITGTLATQAMLKGVGVGDETSTVTAATVTWILKDGTGMLGRILFAWSKGSKLDCDAKQWRLFADVLNDVAIFMEIVAPAFPACFTLIVCTSGFFKCIVGVAGGATRAALTMHQARRNNMADVSAKDGSQETLVNLAGLLFSLLLIPLVADNLCLTYSLYGLFTVLHLYANYRAVRAICMETLNWARLRLVLCHFLRWEKVPDPALVNPQEPLLPGFRQQLSMTLGAPLHTVASSVADFQKALEGNSTNHLIFFNRAAGTISVLLHRQAGSVDVIKACTHTLILEALLCPDVSAFLVERESLLDLQHKLHEGPCNKDWVTVSEIHRLLNRIFPKFLTGLTEAGWIIDRNLLGPEEWRLDWTVPKKKIL
ncbi:RUS family member 1 [Hemicordylus capensis]|uniref:RUS family member 1 n=1 Tax=Hemicordylus capensis TaxID=884348 RepID=UPI002303435A|nr:RUS family member 1 [Hemicordylus capensis]XP_053116754.1 RUS family member 1 [Hemicordylus capensis]XP_053116755.1 RUS family member 1 [Hemicordylus capensis]XP_053116756.1 RUS family member 1 [Hemicordylus capensis]XP_053116757.1 RUS family member 1 [Hemicordylus capensis]XP_053116759.1 RUS family member 1 [Hemicordylus capensis]XP_053116760.1 RUS family member 1 [Hemicordylus capensis]XP_053116761.1 RUS family member 1 [Hemicordylus capensis]XP_053116762.1 RUS family member 1 [Hemicor